MLTLKPQEIPFDHPESDRLFQPGSDKPLVATPAAIEMYREQIHACLAQLQELAREHHGIDRLQVFTDPEKTEALWIIDDEGGPITALLPSDY
jgi:hypothetical protein